MQYVWYNNVDYFNIKLFNLLIKTITEGDGAIIAHRHQTKPVKNELLINARNKEHVLCRW